MHKKVQRRKIFAWLANEVEEFVRKRSGRRISNKFKREWRSSTLYSKYNDTYLLKESDVLKIDIGVHVNGYICDGAITVNLDNKFAKQIEANELALNNAISVSEYNKPIEK